MFSPNADSATRPPCPPPLFQISSSGALQVGWRMGERATKGGGIEAAAATGSEERVEREKGRAAETIIWRNPGSRSPPQMLCRHRWRINATVFSILRVGARALGTPDALFRPKIVVVFQY